MSQSWHWVTISVVHYAVVAVIIVVILRRPREPGAMLAWILTVVLVPAVGLILFLLLGEPRREWHRMRREQSREEIMLRSAAFAERPSEASVVRDAGHEDPGLEAMMRLASRIGAYPPTQGNQVTVYRSSEKSFLGICDAIQAARSHVHLEYFVFQPDRTGQQLRDVLIAKARDGVQCRLLLDYVGSWRLTRRFTHPLRAAGVEVAFALPVIPWQGRWRVNFRDHRKIAVVDGLVGFTGSQNIGDEYRGRMTKLGLWQDTHMKITGPAVHHLQEVFVLDWHYTTRHNLASPEYFPSPESQGRHVVQIVSSGPDQQVHVMHQLLSAILGAARSSICVITPYFVPDEAMLLAFQAARYRGVHVQLIVPSCSNHRIALGAGRSYYD